MSIWELCIRRPVFTTVLMMSLVLVGIMGYTRMGVDLMPDFDIPVVSVVTTYVGADPEVIDQDVTDVIEEQVGTLEGIKSITSTSYESYSTIIIEFELSRNIDVATQEVRDKVNAAMQNLPDDIEQPVVQKIDPDAQAIIYLALRGDIPYQQLSMLADDVIKERLQNISGVGSVTLNGYRDRNIRIWLDPKGMEKYQVGPAQILSALTTWHVELPGGRVENATSESTIKMKGEFESVDELKNLAVDWRNGAPVRLSDLAKVEDGEDDVRSYARRDGDPCIVLAVAKQSGTNTVGVARAVKEMIPNLQALAPPGVKLEVMYDTSEFIEQSVNGVGEDLIIGGIMTAVIIFVFLRNLRMTIISMIAIPTSLMGAFGFMYFMGFTVNQITMLAMSLAVGLVIDDTIVVLENIFRTMEETDLEPRKAAAAGTGEVAFAVLAATMAIAAIFLPVAFMGGMIGRIFYQFGITIGIAIMLSYCVSITLTPMLCGRMLTREHHEGFIARLFGSMFTLLDKIYKVVLEIALRNRVTRVLTLLLALAVFIAGLMLSRLVGTEFAPNPDRSGFMVTIETPIGTSLPLTNERSLAAEKLIRSHKEVDMVACFVGNPRTGQVNQATMIVELVPKSQRSISQQDFMDMIGDELKNIPGATCYPAHFQQMGGSSGRNADLNYVLQGPDLKTLEKLSGEIVDMLNNSPDTRDADDDLELIQPQISVYPLRDAAADVKLDTRQIAVALQIMMGGYDAAKFKIGGKRYDIRMKADDSFRVNADAVGKIILRTPAGTRVELGNIAKIVEGLGPNSIKRYDRMRSVTIKANTRRGVSTGEASARLEAKVAQLLEKYPQYKFVSVGMTKVQKESMGYMMFALFSSVVIIYLVLAAQFESFIQPLTIMTTLPLTVVGVFLGLLLTGKTFSVFSIIGLIMLVGIVTRNGILLVEFANQQREKGLSDHQAMLRAGATRLRPILMTAISTITGVIPVALGLSEGGEVRAGMGIAVIGGMTTSTFLTLIVVPAAYLTLEGISRRGSSIWNRLTGKKDVVKEDAHE